MSLLKAIAFLVLIPIKTVADALQAAVFYLIGVAPVSVLHRSPSFLR